MATSHYFDLRNRKFADIFTKEQDPKSFKMDLSPTSLALWMRDDMSQADQVRLQRYYDNWLWYLGTHWGATQGSKDGIKRIVHNYIKAFANKLNRFLNINGFVVILPEKFEKLGRQLNKIWEINKVKLMALKNGLNGVITGDAWIRVNFKNEGDRKAISFTPIDSSLVFPKFDRRLKLAKVEIRHPMPDSEGNLNPREFVAEVHDRISGTVRFYKNNHNEDPDAEIKDLAYDIPVKDTLLLVHIANFEVANSFWGLDDLTDIIPLNKERNEVASSMREVIDYQEQPVTVVKGAKLKNIDKSSRKIWSGIPKDGDVSILSLNTDLPATQSYLDLTLQTMHDISGIPQQSLGRIQQISNTSGIALHYQNLPLMEVRADKLKTYSEGYKELTVIVIKLLKWMNAIAQDVPEDMLEEEFLIPDLAKENPMQEMEIFFPSPLPRDEILLVNQIDALERLGLISEDKAYRMLGWKPEEIERIRNEKSTRPIMRPAPALVPGQEGEQGSLGGTGRDKADDQNKSAEPKN